MTIQPIADLDGLKTRIRATWMAGDYGSVAALTESAANDFIDRRQIKPNMQVLDVACGNGNLSIPAARAGAAVTGVDISPNLLDQARARAMREKLNIRFEEGDAENLPVAAGAFDLSSACSGDVRAATRPCCRRAAPRLSVRRADRDGELDAKRLHRRGVSSHRQARRTARRRAESLQWGDEATVRERLGADVKDLQVTRRLAQLKFPFSIPETVDFYRVHYGPL